MKRMVRDPKPAAFSASTITCLISLMPPITAENSMKLAWVTSAMIFASVVPLDLHPQRFAWTEQVLLAHVVVQGAGTHSLGERGPAGRLQGAFVGNLTKQAHASILR